MTPVFCCGFECGIFMSSAVNTYHFTTTTGTPSIQTSVKRSGDRALRCNPTASTSTVTHGESSNATVWVFRFYVRFDTLPSSDCHILRQQFIVPTGIIFKNSDSKLYISVNSVSVGTGVEVATERWYRIDYRVDQSSAPILSSFSVDGIEVTDSSSSGNFGINTFILGAFNTCTANIFFDDLIVSRTSADYPIGDGYVNHFIPTSDGTHTATTTTIVKGTIAAPTGGGNVAGATDVFNWVDGVPLLGGATDNTRLVNQQTAGATLYAECIFGAAPNILTPRYAPRAVEVITADRQASTAVGVFSTKLNDNGTEDTIINRTGAGAITDRFVRKQYATMVGGGGWTVARFNGLRARFGYSSDANPDQYWRGIMIEAEFAQWRQNVVQINQAIKRSSYM